MEPDAPCPCALFPLRVPQMQPSLVKLDGETLAK